MAIDLVLDGVDNAPAPSSVAPAVTTETVLAEVEQLTPEEKAQIEEKNVIESHIKMFVNDFSEVVGEKGERALEQLWLLSDC